MNGSSLDEPAARVDRRTLAAVAVVAVLVLAACTGGDDPPPPDATFGGDGGSGQAFDPDRDGPAAPLEGAVAGGTVTVLGVLGPSSLDPAEAYDAYTSSILSGLVTRSLTQYVYDPAQASMVLVPDLATDLGTSNADFTQWTFTIRDGVRFEDGTEVTADDVAYGIKRSFDRKSFPGGPKYSNNYFLDDDNYQGPYTSGTDYAGVVVEGNTLTLKMERPFPDMPYYAAFPAMGPIQQRHSDPPQYGRHPLATGPYKSADYTPGKALTLVRNEEWDPNTDPGRHAYPDRYEFTYGVPQERIDATILGDSVAAQNTLSMDSVLADDYRKAQALNRLTLTSEPCTYMWYPDYRKITDIEVRQAIGYAYPYADAAKISGFIVGVTALPGTSILPPGFPGRQDYNVLETEPGRTDPDKAKALLREAGYAPGEYEISFISYPDQPVPEKVIVTSLEEAGFKATPYRVPTDEFFDVMSDPDAPINLRIRGWCSDWPSGNGFFPDLFRSGSEANYAHLDEPEIDAEIERIGQLPVEEQPAAWGALDQLIMTDYYPVVVTGYRGDALLHGSRIGGMNGDNTFGMPTWKDIYVVQ